MLAVHILVLQGRLNISALVCVLFAWQVGVVILFLTHLQGRGGLIQWTQCHTVIRIYDSSATPLAQLAQQFAMLTVLDNPSALPAYLAMLHAINLLNSHNTLCCILIKRNPDIFIVL